jgi:uncharacterized protein (UPF0276 family)
VDIPVLGIGMVHAPGLEPLLEAGSDLLDVIEIEPQLSRQPDGRYRLHEDLFSVAERFPQPKLIHGVGFPVGGTQRPAAADLAPFVAAVERTAPGWASEHLSFNQVSLGGREFFGGFLLPPVQTPEAARIAAGNIQAVKNLLPVPFAFETGVSYLEPVPGEMTDGAFFASVAEQADCGILLDLHNLWCNERNGRQHVLDVLAELPLDRVWEVHLAGGTESDGLWLDAHSGPPPDSLYELAEQVLPALPNLGAVIFEVSPEALGLGVTTTAEVLEHLHRIRHLWQQTKQHTSQAAATPPRPRITVGTIRTEPAETSDPARTPEPAGTAGNSPAAPAHWEAALAALTVNVPDLVAATRSEYGSDLVDRLAGDRCIPTLRRLVKSFRDGVVATVLPLTFRMIMFHGGEQAFHDLLSDFWRMNPPPRFLAEELDPILDHLRAHSAEIPHVDEVAAYELAARRVRESRMEERVRFTCEPIALLSDLAEYRSPRPAEPGEYELLVTP